MVGELSVESQAIDHGWTQMNTDYFNCGAPGLGETSAECWAFTRVLGVVE